MADEPSPLDQFSQLVQRIGTIKEAEVAAAYDRLKSVTADELLGRWQGFSLDTGHPLHRLLTTFKWAGKDFHSVDDVDPIMMYNAQDERVWYQEYGHASLRQVEYRGIVSTAMIYDRFPIIDSFRYVADNVVMGAMENKDMKDSGTYYFYLKKLEMN
ncbi:hypothetical protein ASPZODRAFT_16199 [Penicilliopsis zonata CBS 506.65]|uniref:GXWXG domain-containing protein n=1 Tax=Penicilliopsis zonata CBS 506.65 TaxID=1073090 RepID=A0A1L9SH10_9EURO|nr:hypothetical protein ASPZODRAFT_16199 [Penicilliopsis zonata CBS 506.65]OJJ46438.1 hypothetical protein ASPZODRAFT_16199 [Penicilliopsis zonata CBS 506.65]